MLTIVTFNMWFNHLRYLVGQEFNPDALLETAITDVIEPMFRADGTIIACLQELNSYPGLPLGTMLADTIPRRTNCVEIAGVPRTTKHIWSEGSRTLSNVKQVTKPVFLDLNNIMCRKHSTYRPSTVFELIHMTKIQIVDHFALSCRFRMQDKSVVQVVNLHLTSSDFPWAKNRREKQLSIIRDHLHTQSIPCIVAGDFNQSPQETLAMMRRTDWQKCYVDGLTTVAKHLAGIDTHDHDGTIDYCIPDARLFKLQHVRTLDIGKYESDHRAMAFKFTSTCMCSPKVQP